MNRHQPNGHTDWCARDHRCGINDHRGEPIMVDLPGHGRAVLTRVHIDGGTDHAEIRIRVALDPAEPAARRQLHTMLTDLRELVTRAVHASRPTPGGRR